MLDREEPALQTAAAGVKVGRAPPCSPETPRLLTDAAEFPVEVTDTEHVTAVPIYAVEGQVRPAANSFVGASAPVPVKGKVGAFASED